MALSRKMIRIFVDQTGTLLQESRMDFDAIPDAKRIGKHGCQNNKARIKVIQSKMSN